MALVLHNTYSPLGQFDGYTGETLTFKGGEIATLASMPWPAAGAQDVDDDGYVQWGLPVGRAVPGVTRALLSATSRPIFLTDDGIQNYGTLFGAVVGGAVGSQVNGPGSYTGAVLGPHTATGSGKISLWGNSGLFGTTLDAVDTAANGLIPNSTALMQVGIGITYTSTGLLTPAVGGNAIAGSPPIVARLASFETNGSLVTTPGSLVAALNSPSGDVTSVKPNTFYQAVYWFNGSDPQATI
jgi:hypothetical protein